MRRDIFALTAIVLMVGMTVAAYAQEAGTRQRPDWLSRMDKNGDGFVTRDELPDRFPAQRFERLDRNKDGKISKQESDAIRRRVENQRRRQASLPFS